MDNLTFQTLKLSVLWRFPKLLCLVLIKIYQGLVSPLTPGCCRFEPTCSEYAISAIETHGFVKGSWYSLKRISRCQPWGKWGFDPVPLSSLSDKKCDHVRIANHPNQN